MADIVRGDRIFCAALDVGHIDAGKLFICGVEANDLLVVLFVLIIFGKTLQRVGICVVVAEISGLGFVAPRGDEHDKGIRIVLSYLCDNGVERTGEFADVGAVVFAEGNVEVAVVASALKNVNVASVGQLGAACRHRGRVFGTSLALRNGVAADAVVVVGHAVLVAEQVDPCEMLTYGRAAEVAVAYGIHFKSLECAVILLAFADQPFRGFGIG
ncbi:unknown [Anaerotruncus sp. CAG:390]|nr:unknown [Anaerotruncus sp. CAG:390]